MRRFHIIVGILSAQLLPRSSYLLCVRYLLVLTSLLLGTLKVFGGILTAGKSLLDLLLVRL